MKTLFVHITWVLVLFRISYAGRKNELNLSKGTIDPKRFWPVRSGKNETLDNRSEHNKAVMYNVKLQQLSIPGAVFDTDALVFTGNADSFVQIYNTDDSLQATDAICIAFYVYSEDSEHVGVLLEYFGADYNSGLRILYNKTNIDVNFYDGSGNLIYFNSSITVPVNTWKLIGINFNKLWDIGDQFDVFEIVLGSVTKSTFEYDSSIPSIDAVGDIRLGGSFDESCSFKGKISCIQFYNYSHIGGLQKDIEDLCNSVLLSTPDMGENTYADINVNLSSAAWSFSNCTQLPRRTLTTVAAGTTSVTEDTTPVTEDTTSVTADTTPITADNTSVTANTTPDTEDTTPVTADTTPDTEDTTPVTADTTPITADTTPVTADTTPITAETTPILANITPDTADTMPITADTMPVTADNTPVTADTTPVTADTTPTSADSTLVTEDTTPVTADTTPVTADTTPTTADITPVTEDTTSVTEDTTPITADITPVTADTTPVTANTTPITADTTPITADTMPVTADTTPITADTTPVTVDTTPITVDTTPITADTTPITADTTPITADTMPVTADTTPITVDTTPVTIPSVFFGSSSTMIVKPLNRCLSWFLLAEDFRLTSIIYSSQEPSLRACVRSCINNTKCKAFAFNINADYLGNHECNLNINSNSVHNNLGYNIYVMR